MLSRSLARFSAFFLPFTVIATALQELSREIRILRELYELELSSRSPSIIRVTEFPRADDTLVIYGDPDSIPRDDAEDLWAEWALANEAEDQDHVSS